MPGHCRCAPSCRLSRCLHGVKSHGPACCMCSWCAIMSRSNFTAHNELHAQSRTYLLRQTDRHSDGGSWHAPRSACLRVSHALVFQRSAVSAAPCTHRTTIGSLSKHPHAHTRAWFTRYLMTVLRLKSKGSLYYSITERRVPELIPVLGSQPAGDVSHKPGGRLPLLSARLAFTPPQPLRAATNFAAS